MLDPFVDGRGGVGGAAGRRSALRRRDALPDEIALAYAKAMKAPVTEAPPPGFEQRWSAWGGGFGGATAAAATPPARQPRSFRAHRRFCRRPRLSPHAGHGGRLRARRRRHQLGPGAGAGRRQERRLPGRRLRHHARRVRPISPPRFAFANHWMSTDRIAFARRPSHRRLQRAEFWRTHRGRLSLRTTMLGGFTPYAALQAQSFRTPVLQRDRPHRRRLRARLRCPHRHRHAQRARRPLRSCRGARSHSAADAARAASPGRTTGSPIRRSSPAFQTLPGASFIVNGARAGEGFRARLGRRGAAPRQRRHATRQVRRRIRRARRTPMPAPPPCATRGETEAEGAAGPRREWKLAPALLG